MGSAVSTPSYNGRPTAHGRRPSDPQYPRRASQPVSGPHQTYTRYQQPPYPMPNVAYVSAFPAHPWPPHQQQMPMTYPQFPHPATRTSSWSESRDKAFSRILSAEEFLARIQEHDTMIQAANQLQDRHQYVPAIAQLLNLRGHLYGELVRIQMMLAADDPQMKSIAEFEVSHAAVVQKLRDLKDQSDRLHDAATGTDPEASGHGSTSRSAAVSFQTQTSSTIHVNGEDARPSTAHGSDAGTQSDRVEQNEIGVGVGTDSHSMECGPDGDGVSEGVDMATMTEEDLKEKHSQEETRVAEKFARQIAARQLSTDEVNRVLAEHANSVQHLRIRQQAERDRFWERLEQKRRERRRTSGLNDEDCSSDDDESMSNDVTSERRTDEIPAIAMELEHGTTDLGEAVRRLEMMRLNGELTADAVASMMGRYLPPPAADPAGSSSRSQRDAQRHRSPSRQDDDEMRESVSHLVHEKTRNQQQIQARRQQEKEHMDEKLKQKLKEKSHQHQQLQDRRS